ncbi:5137_t:CDS:1, partial [Cetraspora pellucida]
DRKFMQNYKKRFTELYEAEDLNIHVLDIAKRIFPNEEKYIESKK